MFRRIRHRPLVHLAFTGPALLLLAFALALLVPPSSAHAQELRGLEVETDPIAWALDGFSLHAATLVGPTRLNVGVFGIEIPTGFHGNDGWTSTMRGAGMKWDWVGDSSEGLFAGIDGGWMQTRYSLDDGGGREERDVFGLGLRGGYRYLLGSRGLYVSPWVSVSYNALGDQVAIGDATFDRSRIIVFPTLHIGWSF